MNMNYPIRIAQIIGEAPNGGVEAVIRNYYEHIDRSKYQFDFYVNNTSDIIRRDKIEEMGGRIFIVPPYKKNIFAFEKFLYNKFKEEKYLIVHSNMNALSCFVLRAAKKAGVPIRIAHSHSTSNPHEFVRNSIKNVLRLKSKKYATNLVACSEVAGRWLFGDKAFDQGKVTIFNNGIDIDKFRFDEAVRIQARNELSIPQDSFVIGNVGRFVKQKNQIFLIHIFAEICKKDSNTYLLLVGDGPLRVSLEKEAKELCVADKVIFAGVHKHPSRFYDAMDCFVLPSFYEGLPVVGVEAQVNGLACFFSNTITSEIKLTDNSDFLSLEDDALKWASSIIEKKETPLEVRKDIYRTFVNLKYDLNHEAIKLSDYYEMALLAKDNE